MSGTVHPEQARELLTALDAYRQARQAFLAAIATPASNRDPLAEFSEQFVRALLGGSLAESRVQAGYDLTLTDGRRVQVRYLANTGSAWVNEHRVGTLTGVDLYALVIFEAFAVVGVLVLPTGALGPIGTALGKRHPTQDRQLQFTARNWRTIRDDAARFEELGVRIHLPPFLH